jgi:hypothetical protein
MLSVTGLLISFAVGAGVLALWIQFRFPKLCPEDMRRTLIHVGIALVLAQLLVPVLLKTVPPKSAAGLLVMLMVLALPALIYCFLASIWVIKVAQSSLQHR